MKAFVLTYHSHHVLGPHYHLNDHIAFPRDLELVTEAGYRIVPLATIVDELVARAGTGAASAERGARYVALTFDDGPIYDLDDFIHPQLGRQRGFVGAMQDFAERDGGQRQPGLHATSFVIASPEARRAFETTFDAEYTYLAADSMGDEWWQRAIATGLLGIANHSWDHLHPGLERVAHSRDVRADFTQVDNRIDADAEILAAARYIDARTGGKSSPYFAYPFGQCNSYLASTYLPAFGPAAGIRAAFTAEPRPVRPDDNVFSMPRYICGHDWKTPEELAAILASA